MMLYDLYKRCMMLNYKRSNEFGIVNLVRFEFYPFKLKNTILISEMVLISTTKSGENGNLVKLSFNGMIKTTTQHSLIWISLRFWIKTKGKKF